MFSNDELERRHKEQQKNAPAGFPFEFYTHRGGISIECNLSDETKIEIPEEFNGQKVVDIATGGTYRSGYWENVESIVFPNTLKNIYHSSFYQAKRLKEIELPEGLVSVWKSAFERCSSVTRISVSKSLERIDCFAFACCDNLETITVDSENPYYCTVEGVLYTKDLSRLMLCPARTKEKTIHIPNTVTTIDELAFRMCRDMDIYIPNSVTNFGRGAFTGCENLRVHVSANSEFHRFIEEDMYENGDISIISATQRKEQK